MTQQRFRRGDIWTVDLEPVVGSEQGKARPALIIQNDIGNQYSPVLIVAAIGAKSRNYKVRLGGVIANRSDATDEVDRFCEATGMERLAHFPDLDVIRKSRLKKSTLFEMPPTEELERVQQEYLDLAQALWNGTDPLSPHPLEDRDIFELLGFD